MPPWATSAELLARSGSLSLATVIVVLVATVGIAVLALCNGLQAIAASSQLRVQTGDAAVLFGACATIIGLQFLAKNASRMLGRKWDRLQLPRRVQHAASGVFIAGLYAVLPWTISVGALATGFLALALLQALRRASPSVDAQFLAAFGAFLREEERRGAPPAALSFLAGSLFSALCFPHRIVLAVILGAGLGDPAAAIVGSYVGGPRLLGSKTVSGFSACALVAGACGAGLVVSGAVSCSVTFTALPAAAVQAFALCGICVALAELFGNVGGLFGDDNFGTLFGAGCLLSMFRATGETFAAPGTALVILFARDADDGSLACPAVG